MPDRPATQKPLPRSVRPFHNETVDSFIARAAAANHIAERELRQHLGVRLGKTTPVTHLLEPLAAAVAMPHSALRLALPEFLDPSRPESPGTIGRPLTSRRKALRRPACRRCTRAANIDMPVICWTTHERNICLRHQLWVGHGCTTAEDQVDISLLPKTLRAQRHHRNLIARHGRRWVCYAYPDARKIWKSWFARSADPFGLVSTAQGMLRDGNGQPPSQDMIFSLLFYPQSVALAGLLASNAWERQALRTGDVVWLLEEVTRRGILIGYQPEDNDALVDWIDSHLGFHKFAYVHGQHLYDVLFSEETIRAALKPGRPIQRPRINPIHGVHYGAVSLVSASRAR